MKKKLFSCLLWRWKLALTRHLLASDINNCSLFWMLRDIFKWWIGVLVLFRGFIQQLKCLFNTMPDNGPFLINFTVESVCKICCYCCYYSGKNIIHMLLLSAAKAKALVHDQLKICARATYVDTSASERPI